MKINSKSKKRDNYVFDRPFSKRSYTKILALGDLHNDVNLAKLVAEKAKKEKVDFVVLNGDLGTFGRTIGGLISPFKEFGIKVMVLPGNHDEPSFFQELIKKYDLIDLHNKYYLTENGAIIGLGGSVNGPFNISSESEIEQNLEMLFRKVSSKTKLENSILITHNHPANSLAEKLSHHIVHGSKSIHKAIMKFSPKYLAFAHSHESRGLEEQLNKTKIVSVSRSPRIFRI